MIAQTYLKMGRYKEAVVYPHRMLVAGPDWRKKHWPGMLAHLEQCYKSGAKRPKKVDVSLDADYRMALPMERALEDVRRRYGLTGDAGDRVLSRLRSNERRRFVLLRNGVAHLKALGEAEERAHANTGGTTGKALSPAFWKRLEVLRELVKAEEAAWRTDRDVDEAIVTYGGLERVPRSLRDRHALRFKKLKALKERLAEAESAKSDSEKTE
jgi:hypothetical protein